MSGTGGFSQAQLSNYLNYIGMSLCEYEQLPPMEALEKLVLQHSIRVPFENLSVIVPNATGVVIDIATIYQKIVVNKRGGYCFEQNYLLFHVLHILGYLVELRGARVVLDTTVPEEEGRLSHLFLLVRHPSTPVDALYLVDVGFGGYSPIGPVKVALNEKTHLFGTDYFCQREVTQCSITMKKSVTWRLCIIPGDRTEDFSAELPLILYTFSLDIQMQLADLVQGSYYESTHPTSIFFKRLFVSAVVEAEKGNLERISLWDLRKSCLPLCVGAKKTFTDLKTAEELQETLNRISLKLQWEDCIALFEKIQTCQTQQEAPPNA